jgi:predicted dehydrogenase
MNSPRSVDRRAFLKTVGATSSIALAPIHSGSLAASSASPGTARIKVAVIGCGSVSTKYLPHLSSCPHVELVAVCDIIPDRALRAAQEHKIPSHHPHIDKLLAGAPFDFLVNLTDMQEHGRLNKQALEAGKHVWSEKPLANSYTEGKALLDLARARNLRIWGAPIVVESLQFAAMARLLSQGKLGRVAAAHASYCHLGPDWSAFFYEKLGGPMPDLAVYNLTTLTGLLGPARSVVAMSSIITPTRTVGNKGTIKVEAEDNAMVLLEHPEGAISHVQTGFNYFEPHGHDGGEHERPTIELVGTAGRLGLIGYDWAPHGVELATLDHPEPAITEKDPGAYVWEQGASLAAESLATGKGLRVTPEHALHVVEILEAARASQETGRRIPLQSTFRWPIVS